MAQSDLTSKEWCELIFDQKNKAYGAYELRKGLAHRHLIGLILTTIIAALIVLIPFIVSLIPESADENEDYLEVTELSTLEEAEVKDENLVREVEMAVTPPPLASSIKLTELIIAPDDEVREGDEMKSQEELSSSRLRISIADVKGNDDVHGADIADVKDYVVQAKPQKEDENKIYETVEQEASFPGGMQALYKWLGENLKYPQIAADQGIEGVVQLRFVVSKTGQISSVRIVRALDPYCDKEAERVISRMPRWTPAKMNGVAVAAYHTLPIRFKLD